ncbi:protein insensitive [Calliphora vicina]|uniref:protein insensitive n=1 Tax=Calliphora vicina TaxID=7373 RepID=UPI00325C0AC0
MSVEDNLNTSASSQLVNSIDYQEKIDRFELILKRQAVSTSAFNRLLVVMDQIFANSKPPTKMPQLAPHVNELLMDHNYAVSNTSSGIYSASSSSSSSSPPPSSSSPSCEDQLNRFNRCLQSSAKRKLIDDDQEYQEFSAETVPTPALPEEKEQEEYPQQLGEVYILGPNGTEVEARSYDSIIWSSAAAATRQLLGFVFSGDVLATHTLTGKPSPAFYGRERPAKMQLDPVKAADIIHCVRSKFKCTEREIRAAITTKCSDTSKKYKRRQQKQLESSNAAVN